MMIRIYINLSQIKIAELCNHFVIQYNFEFQGVPEKKLFKSRVASQKIALLFRVCVIYH